TAAVPMLLPRVVLAAAAPVAVAATRPATAITKNSFRMTNPLPENPEPAHPPTQYENVRARWANVEAIVSGRPATRGPLAWVTNLLFLGNSGNSALPRGLGCPPARSQGRTGLQSFCRSAIHQAAGRGGGWWLWLWRWLVTVAGDCGWWLWRWLVTVAGD